MSHREVLIISCVMTFVGTMMFISAGTFDHLQLAFFGRQSTARVESVNVEQDPGTKNRKGYSYYLTVEGTNGEVRYSRSRVNYLADMPESGSAQPKNLKLPVVVSNDGKKVAIGTKRDLAAGLIVLLGLGVPLLAIFALAMREYWVRASQKGAKQKKKH
jgi:hypothetical protein